MKVAFAQINTTVGDFRGNVERVRAALDRGRAEGVDLVVFPEQTLPGYPAEDLLERREFIDCAEREKGIGFTTRPSSRTTES